MQIVVYTVGHSTRTAVALVALLQTYGIELVVDVRRFPGSRRHPQFSAERLAGTLHDVDIGYLHAEALGGRRPVVAASPNAAWRNAGFRGYADHMATPEFRRALENLERLAVRQRLAVMCAEAVPWRCHRNLLADALVARGIEVRHILSEDQVQVHELNAAARVQPDGSLVYADREGQLELLD